jgi:hypothetical protein
MRHYDAYISLYMIIQRTTLYRHHTTLDYCTTVFVDYQPRNWILDSGSKMGYMPRTNFRRVVQYITKASGHCDIELTSRIHRHYLCFHTSSVRCASSSFARPTATPPLHGTFSPRYRGPAHTGIDCVFYKTTQIPSTRRSNFS